MADYTGAPAAKLIEALTTFLERCDVVTELVNAGAEPNSALTASGLTLFNLDEDVEESDHPAEPFDVALALYATELEAMVELVKVAGAVDDDLSAQLDRMHNTAWGHVWRAAGNDSNDGEIGRQVTAHLMELIAEVPDSIFERANDLLSQMSMEQIVEALVAQDELADVLAARDDLDMIDIASLSLNSLEITALPEAG